MAETDQQRKNRLARERYHKDLEAGRARNRGYNQKPEAKAWRSDYMLKRRYGIDRAMFEAMLKFQENKCLICSSEFFEDSRYTQAYVDHDHTSGEVRALLCQKCNLGIGHFRDSLSLVTKAVAYLERFQK